MSGGEISLLTFLSCLDRSKYTPFFAYNDEGEFVNKVRSLGIECVRVPISSRVLAVKREEIGLSNVVSGFRDIWPIVKQLRVIIKKYGIDLLHTNSLKSNIIGGLSAFALIPNVWHQRDILEGRLRVIYKIAALFLAKRVICISEVVKSSLDLKKCIKIYNGIKTDYSDGYSAVEHRNASITVSMIGRIAEWKNQAVFIEAARGVEARFNIAGSAMFPGDSDYEVKLRANAPENVKFLGFVNSETVINESDIIVHCSKEPEPFGMVIVEAMAFKKPVIASNIGAPREILEDAGLTFNPADASELKQKILLLIGDPLLRGRLGQKGYERFKEYFTGTREALEIMKLYDALLDQGRSKTC